MAQTTPVLPQPALQQESQKGCSQRSELGRLYSPTKVLRKAGSLASHATDSTAHRLQHPSLWGSQGGTGHSLPCTHSPAVDADGDAVIWLVAANLANELQNGVNGRGNVVVRPVLVVELVDGARCLRGERTAGRTPSGHQHSEVSWCAEPPLILCSIDEQRLQAASAICSCSCSKGHLATLWGSPYCLLAWLTHDLICYNCQTVSDIKV